MIKKDIIHWINGIDIKINPKKEVRSSNIAFSYFLNNLFSSKANLKKSVDGLNQFKRDKLNNINDNEEISIDLFLEFFFYFKQICFYNAFNYSSSNTLTDLLENYQTEILNKFENFLENKNATCIENIVKKLNDFSLGPSQLVDETAKSNIMTNFNKALEKSIKKHYTSDVVNFDSNSSGGLVCEPFSISKK